MILRKHISVEDRKWEANGRSGSLYPIPENPPEARPPPNSVNEEELQLRELDSHEIIDDSQITNSQPVSAIKQNQKNELLHYGHEDDVTPRYANSVRLRSYRPDRKELVKEVEWEDSDLDQSMTRQ